MALKKLTENNLNKDLIKELRDTICIFQKEKEKSVNENKILQEKCQNLEDEKVINI